LKPPNQLSRCDKGSLIRADASLERLAYHQAPLTRLRTIDFDVENPLPEWQQVLKKLSFQTDAICLF
jgi:hypothetical protein